MYILKSKMHFHVILLNAHRTTWVWYHYYTHFTIGKTKCHRDWVTAKVSKCSENKALFIWSQNQCPESWCTGLQFSYLGRWGRRRVSLSLLVQWSEFKTILGGLETLFMGSTFAGVTLGSSSATAIIIILPVSLRPWTELFTRESN